MPTSTAMRACQMAILELINLCIKEVKMCNPSVSMSYTLGDVRVHIHGASNSSLRMGW